MGVFLKTSRFNFASFAADYGVRKNDSPDTALFFEFHAEQLDRSFHWGEKVLRDLGWQGVIVQNSQSKRVGYGVSRWRCAHAVEAHGYFAHPSAMMSSGSQTYQRSSIEGLAEQFRSINSVRLYGRAFQVGEYNHVFWNRYIHEGGVVFPALAAFQDIRRLPITPIRIQYAKAV